MGLIYNFLTFSNNGGTTATQTTEITTSFISRINKEWLVQQTGSIGAVNVKFDDGSNSFAGLTLIGDGDGDFSSGAFTVGNLDANGELANVEFIDGFYYTLGTLASPGGVSPQLSLWLKENYLVFISGPGSTPQVTDWIDDSGNNHDLTAVVGRATRTI